MSTTAPNGGGDVQRVDLSPTEQWVLHHLMVDRLDEAREEYSTPPWWAVEVVEKLERGELSFSTFEAWRLCRTLERYLEDGDRPERDADDAASLLAAFESRFESPPASLRN